jgi:hypothetical protein
MRTALRSAPLLLAAVTALSLPARADDKATREAQARFEEGIRRVKAGDYESARMSFTQAYAVLKKNDILWNLALSEQKSGHPVEAIGHFKLLMRAATKPDDRAAAQKHVNDLTGIVAHIDVAAPPGSQVTLDGNAAGVAPLYEPLDVDGGRHHVEIRTPQGVTKAADADAVTGQTAHVSFLSSDSAPVAAAVPPAAAPTDAQPPSPAPSVAPASTAPPSPETPPSSHGTFWDARGITVVSLGGLALVSAGLGLAFGISSNNDANTASSLRTANPNCSGFSSPGCQQLQSVTQSEHSAYVTSEGFWIAGGVFAAAAVGAYFLWPRPAPAGAAATTHVQVLPSAGSSGAGVLAVGSF